MQIYNSAANLNGWETSSENQKHSIIIENVNRSSYDSSESMSHNSKDFKIQGTQVFKTPIA